MNKEASLTLKKIIFIDFVVGLSISIITYYFIGNYSFIFLLGLLIAIVNLLFNGVVTSYLLNKEVVNNLLFMFAFVIRVLVVCFVATLIIKVNKYNIIPYVLGYSSQFIGLIIYGVTINNG